MNHSSRGGREGRGNNSNSHSGGGPIRNNTPYRAHPQPQPYQPNHQNPANSYNQNSQIIMQNNMIMGQMGGPLNSMMVPVNVGQQLPNQQFSSQNSNQTGVFFKSSNRGGSRGRGNRGGKRGSSERGGGRGGKRSRF